MLWILLGVFSIFSVHAHASFDDRPTREVPKQSSSFPPLTGQVILTLQRGCRRWDMDKTILFLSNITSRSKLSLILRTLLPWVPEVFLAWGGNFRCWPKADTSTSGEAARKTSGTERCFLPFPLTFVLFYRITFTPIRLKVSDCDHVGRHVKKCPKTHIILRKTSSSLKFIALRAIMTGSNRSSP